MIQLTLQALIDRTEAALGRKITLGEISEGAKVHRNILSRILNRPESNFSSQHLDRLSCFFFSQLRGKETNYKSDKELMRSIVLGLIGVFPECLLDEMPGEAASFGQVFKRVDLMGRWDIYDMFYAMQNPDTKEGKMLRSVPVLKVKARKDMIKERKGKKH